MDSGPSIIQEILHDREAGATRLVAERRDSLYAAALSLCGDPALAEDLVFRTFERVLDRVATCRDESAFEAWMKAIMRNEWLMSVRRATVGNTVSAGTPSDVEKLAEPSDGADSIAAEVDASILRDAIEELPDAMREAVVLRYLMGLPLAKAAKILAVPVGTVSSRLHYARQILAAKLGAAAKNPKGKALLVALALGALTAVGATVATVAAIVGEARSTPPALSEGTPLSEGGCAAHGSSPLQEGAVAEGDWGSTAPGNSTSPTTGDNMNAIKAARTFAAASLALTSGFTTAFAASAATTWYVASDANGGDEANNGLSPATPKCSLSTLVSNAAEGDTIYVVGTLPVSSTITVAKRLLIAGYGPDAAISGGNTCLPLKLNASGLVVSNLVIHSGSPVGAAANSWTYPASGVAVVNGTLVDCTVRDCSPQGATHTSTINISGPGTVLRCAIINNTAGIQTSSYAAGLFINDSKAVVRDCEIAYNRGRAAAVYLLSGLVTGCDIHDNRGYPASELASGVAVGSGAGIRLDAGILDRSRIHANYSYGSGGGIWIRDNALVRNCLVYGNHAEGSGGAIHANSSSPKAYHCNIGGNTADAGGAAINSEAGSPQYVNCIVFGNGSDPSDEILTASGVTASFTYCLLPVTHSGTGNGVLVDSPFHDEANGDYLTAAPFAAAIDTGRNSLATTDFLGTVRPVDGDGDGTATADIGAVEYHNLPATLEKNTDYVVNCATGAAPTQIYIENASLTLANGSWVNFNSTGNAWETNFLLHVTGGSVATNFHSGLSIPTGGRIVVDNGSTLRLKSVPHEVARSTATGTSMALTNSTLFMAGDTKIYGFSNTVTLCNSRLAGNQTIHLYGIDNRLVFSGDCGTTPISLGVFTGTNNWIVLEDGARFASTPTAKLQCRSEKPCGFHIGRNAFLYLGYTGLMPSSTGCSNGWVVVESGGKLTVNDAGGEGAVSGYNVRLNDGTFSCSNNMMRVGSNSNHWGTRLELNGDGVNVFAMNLVIGNTVSTTNLTIALNPGAGAYGGRAPLWSRQNLSFSGACVFKIDLRAPLRACAANEILRLPVAQAAVERSWGNFTLSAENLAKLNEQLVTQPAGGRFELDGKVLYCVMKRKATTMLSLR